MASEAESAERDELRRKFVTFSETRSSALRDELVESHLGLAHYLARRYRDRGEPLDDLVQVACFGLLKAVDRFDPSLGFEFSTFATRYILGELKRHFRDRTWAVRPPRRLQDLYLRLEPSISALAQDLGRSPTIPEIANHAGVSEEDILEAMEAGQAYRSGSLETPAGPDDATPVANHLGQDDPDLARADDRVGLRALLGRLPPRQREIVTLRFFEGLTQSEIGVRLGISQVHVSRLLDRALGEMREVARE